MSESRYWRDVQEECEYLSMRRRLLMSRRLYKHTAGLEWDAAQALLAKVAEHLKAEAEQPIVEQLAHEAADEVLRVATIPPLRRISPPKAGSIAIPMAWLPIRREGARS